MAIRFLHRGQVVRLEQVAPTLTLLDWLREDARRTGTKEGCGEGDCGACTVVLGELEGEPGAERVRYRAINSCIRLMSSIDGCALWTVEDLQGADGVLHPVQQALVDHHGSQCGFCTPGFVMSMFALYQQRVARCERACEISREEAQEALSGNLCRCTGYRPILEATQKMVHYPRRALDEQRLIAQLRALRRDQGVGDGAALRPRTLDELLQWRAAHPEAQVIAGCTDVGLWITKAHRQFERTLDVTFVRELQRVEERGGVLAIGAAVRLSDAYAALEARWPQLRAFAARFAGVPVRESGTLGGNVANGSPIGDSMPLLIALAAEVELRSVRGVRRLPLEDLYTGYRRNVLAADEVLTEIRVPLPRPGARLAAYKLSKRLDDDISAVCLAVDLAVEDGRVGHAGIGVGGMAATPRRAVQTEAALRGAPWNEATVRRAMETLRQEFAPIDDMRASAAYRREAAGNLLWRYWLESLGQSAVRLDDGALEPLPA
ncbi:MAG TPA: xanthine dehydrogenase small subunit [Burkholderiaceae bacterium]|nr:xanthine dehydrogenase small subunit [Burkholderiaceae bacterium]